MSLKDPLCLLLLAAWNIGSWSFLISFPYDVRKEKEKKKI
jgi:hypothetical protein